MANITRAAAALMEVLESNWSARFGPGAKKGKQRSSRGRSIDEVLQQEVSAGKNNDDTHLHSLKMDIERTYFTPENPGVSISAKDEGLGICLQEILAPLVRFDIYCQGMCDVCAPVVFSGIKTGASLEAVRKYCYMILDVFFVPMMDDSFRDYLKHERVLKRIPGYAPVHRAEGADLSMLEMDSVLLWYVRVLTLPEVVMVYDYFLSAPVWVPFLFFVPARNLIRERKNAIRKCMSLQESNGHPSPASGPHPQSIAKCIRKCREMEKTYGDEFRNNGKSSAAPILLMGAAGICLAVLAAGAIALTKGPSKDRQ